MALYIGWIASLTTAIAAMMTAVNVGPRVTGWGFAVFTAGAICWTVVGLATGQHALFATNAFLTLVDIVGIWRWLGRQRAYDDGGKSAKRASRRSDVPTLFTAAGVAGMPVETSSGQKLGKAVDAMVECKSGTVSYLVVASGGVGGVDEHLRAIPYDRVIFHCDRICVEMSADQFARLPDLKGDDWPAEAATPVMIEA